MAITLPTLPRVCFTFHFSFLFNEIVGGKKTWFGRVTPKVGRVAPDFGRVRRVIALGGRRMIEDRSKLERTGEIAKTLSPCNQRVWRGLERWSDCIYTYMRACAAAH